MAVKKEKGTGKELIKALNDICVEKSIEPDVIFEALETALIAAYKRNFASAQNVRVSIDKKNGNFGVYAQKTVVDSIEEGMGQLQISIDAAKEISGDYEIGDIVDIEVTPRNFGRIAAMTAKQIVTQKIREAERGIIYSEYTEKLNEIVSGSIQRIERGNVFVDIGKLEAILPLNEQPVTERENYVIHQNIQCYVSEVKNGTKGTQIVLSRTHPGLVKKLFVREVPEIASGIVEIKSIAREAGSRTKIAVYSNNPNVDPVGSCIGVNRSRVNAIVEELRGEKIDIINWSDNPAILIENALSPAKVITVMADDEEKTAKVVVPDYQLSLAIGKEGQNARLAARLTGFKIDIKSESQARELEEFAELFAYENTDTVYDEENDSYYEEETIEAEPQTEYYGLDEE